MGDASGTPGWYSGDVMANTSGADVFLDGHAHSVIPSKLVKNSEGKDVILTSTGSKLSNIGVLKLSVKDGKLMGETALIDRITDDEKSSYEYKRLENAVNAEFEKYKYLEKNLGKTEFPLVIKDPSNGKRIIRNSNTNLGDFLTDGYLWYAENDPEGKGFVKADLAILNGGSIRADISGKDINYLNILTVFPWNTRIAEIKVKGQTIVDALEMGARLSPEENGGFLHGSNLTYEINQSVKSNVVLDSKKMFVKVNGDYKKGGYRVQNVKIGGIPVDLNKEYNMVINAYYYKNFGDGMSMFQNVKAIVDDDTVIDINVISAYLERGLNGKVPEKYRNPYGENRINFVADSARTENNTKETKIIKDKNYKRQRFKR